MTTLSTHDTKRSEDVRARLLAVAGDAESLAALLARRSPRRPPHARRRPADRAPAVADAGRGRRRSPTSGCTSYLIKAMREAKQRTVLARRRPGVRGPGARPGRPRPRPRPACTALVPHRGRPQRRRRSAPRCSAAEAAPADACPASRTPTRAASSSTSRWSTPTTAARWTTPSGASRLAQLRRGRRPRDLDDEKLLVTARALRLRRRPELSARALVRPAAGDLRARARLPRSAPRAPRQRARSAAAQVAALVTRAPHRLAVGGGWGDATVDAARGAVARRAHRRRLHGGPSPAGRRARRPTGGPAGVPMTTRR